MPKKVIIYGGGPSLRTASFPDGYDKWSVGTLYPDLGSRINLYFCMHKEDFVHHFTVRDDVGYVDQARYPLDKIVKKYGSKYFTNSISYMIAYAMLKRYKEIILVGIDLEKYGEYVFERPSVAYWCGRAESRGINVVWRMLKPYFLYGYEQEEMNRILRLLKRHKETAEKEFKANTNQRVKDQWIGYQLACDKLIREITS